MPRQLKWFENIQGGVQALANTQKANDLLSNITSANRVGATITRMIGKMYFEAEALTNKHEVFVGVTLVNADAQAAGAFPDADQVDDADWLYHSYVRFSSGNLSDGSQNGMITFDVRSQRKIHAAADRLLLITDVGGFSVFRSHFVRTLVRLP